jgi:hypothetical protein
MVQIVKTSLTSDGFASTVFDAEETAKQYRIQSARRRIVNKVSMMQPDSVMLAASLPVAASIWHTPEQEQEARSLLVEFCRLRIARARAKAKEISAIADTGEAILNAII